MLKIKRAYEKKAASDGKRIYVDRLWPRGLSKEEFALDEWFKDLSPSDDLRKWFGHDPVRWEEFRKRYKEELKAHGDSLGKLRTEGKRGTVTLLFAAKDAEHNNAVVLKEILS